MTNQQDNQSVEEIIESIGYILIRIRHDPTLEFEPNVLKHKLLEIAEAARNKAIDDCIEALPEEAPDEDYDTLQIERATRNGFYRYRTEAIQKLLSLKRKKL